MGATRAIGTACGEALTMAPIALYACRKAHIILTARSAVNLLECLALVRVIPSGVAYPGRPTSGTDASRFPLKAPLFAQAWQPLSWLELYNP